MRLNLLFSSRFRRTRLGLGKKNQLLSTKRCPSSGFNWLSIELMGILIWLTTLLLRAQTTVEALGGDRKRPHQQSATNYYGFRESKPDKKSIIQVYENEINKVFEGDENIVHKLNDYFSLLKTNDDKFDAAFGPSSEHNDTQGKTRVLAMLDSIKFTLGSAFSQYNKLNKAEDSTCGTCRPINCNRFCTANCCTCNVPNYCNLPQYKTCPPDPTCEPCKKPLSKSMNPGLNSEDPNEDDESAKASPQSSDEPTTTTLAPTPYPTRRKGLVRSTVEPFVEFDMRASSLKTKPWGTYRASRTTSHPMSRIMSEIPELDLEACFQLFDMNKRIFKPSKDLRKSFKKIFNALPKRTDRNLDLAWKILIYFGESDQFEHKNASKNQHQATAGTGPGPIRLSNGSNSVLNSYYRRQLTAENSMRCMMGHILERRRLQLARCKPCSPDKTCKHCSMGKCNDVKCPACDADRECPIRSECPLPKQCEPCDKNEDDLDEKKDNEVRLYPNDATETYSKTLWLESATKHSVKKQEATNSRGNTASPVDNGNRFVSNKSANLSTSEASVDKREFGLGCGAAPKNHRSKEIGYIVNGEEQSYGDWPSFARLIVSKVNQAGGFCGGVLISDRHILTAGHCVDGQFKGAKVYLGDHDLNYKDPFEKKFTVSTQPCLSKNFIASKTKPNFDYAILTLDQRVPSFTDYIQPACLPKKSSLHWPQSRSKCYLIGAGIVGFEGMFPIGTLKIRFMRVTQVSCRPKWNISSSDTSRSCWTKTHGDGDSCGGDSGGPILCLDQDSRWTVAALVSYGSNRCDGLSSVGWVGVYTKVSALVDKIRSDCGLV